MSLLNLLTSWLLFLSLAIVIGVALGRWFVLPRPSETEDRLSVFSRPSARLGIAAGALLLAALCLVFLRQILEFHDPFVPWAEDVRLLLTGTPWGRAWLLAVGGALLALASFWLAARGRAAGWVSATAAVLALGAFPAFTGHANTGDLRSLTLIADILHVWAVGGWIGGLAVVLHLEYRRGPRSGDAPSVLPILVPRFSGLALVSVAALLATGLLASRIHIESPAALVETRYGRWLLVKLAVVVLVLFLGARNWRRLKPRLTEPTTPDAMRRVASLEFILANVVLAVTAVLVRTPPMEP